MKPFLLSVLLMPIILFGQVSDTTVKTLQQIFDKAPSFNLSDTIKQGHSFVNSNMTDFYDSGHLILGAGKDNSLQTLFIDVRGIGEMWLSLPDSALHITGDTLGIIKRFMQMYFKYQIKTAVKGPVAKSNRLQISEPAYRTYTQSPTIDFYSSDSTYTAYLGMGDIIDTSYHIYIDNPDERTFHWVFIKRLTHFPFWTSAAPIVAAHFTFWLIVICITIGGVVLLFAPFKSSLN